MTHPSTRVTYPFEGCCEHGPSVHNRDRCLACGCTKPAVQVQTGAPYRGVIPPEEPPDPDGAGLVELTKCGICKALLEPQDREGHLDWHETLINTLTNLANAVAALRQRVQP